MPRLNEGLEKYTIRLDPDDIRVLKQFYPQTGYNRAVRLLVAKHVEWLKEQNATVALPQEVHDAALAQANKLITAAPEQLLEETPDDHAA